MGNIKVISSVYPEDWNPHSDKSFNDFHENIRKELKGEAEVKELCKKSYEAGFQECLEQWSESEGMRVRPYEEFNEDIIFEGRKLPRDQWLEENNL